MQKIQKVVLDKEIIMKQYIKFILFFFLMINNIKCQEKSNNHLNTVDKMNPNNIEAVLIRQLKQGTAYNIDEAAVGLPKIPFEIDELDAVSRVSNDILVSNGYKKLNNEDFSKKIKDIFGRVIDYNLKSKFLYINFLDKCSKEYVMYTNNLLDYEGVFIDKQNKILLKFQYLPELINYQKEYPHLKEIEDSKITRKSRIDNLDINIDRWRDIADLQQQRYSNQQLLIRRNKYLFNDDKTNLVWLQFHDEYFLESLVKTFGYTADKKLLEWYIKRNGIEKYRNNLEEYLKVFYVKTCDNQLIVHKETFDYMDTNPEKYSKEIQVVLDAIRLHEIQLENLSFAEKAKIVAYLLYFGEKHKEKNQMYFQFMGVFYEHSSEDEQKKYDEEFKKNKYYNLPNFQRLWEEAKIDGDGIGLEM